MSTFRVQIITPDGVLFDDEAQRVIVRTTEGDVGIMRNHIDYFAPIGIGPLKLLTKEGQQKIAAVAKGFISVSQNVAKIMAISCEWAEEIDLKRAERAKEIAEEKIKTAKNDKDLLLAQVRLRRALNRIRISKDLQ